MKEGTIFLRIRILAKTSQGSYFLASGSVQDLSLDEQNQFQWHELDLYLPTGQPAHSIKLFRFSVVQTISFGLRPNH